MQDFDTVVIGSGAGGMTAAVASAQAGESVCVLEQHEVPGGWCHSFEAGGHRFSPGVHYLGQLGPDGDFRALYEGLGVADELTFFELNPAGIDRARVGDTWLSFPRGREALAEVLEQRFPAEARGIGNYLSLVQTLRDELTAIAESKGVWDTLTVPYRMRHVGRWGWPTLEQVLEKHVRDPLLKAALALPCGDHGVRPSQVMFAYHCAVAAHYFDGGFYPMGGGAALPLAMSRVLRRLKGEVRLRARVERILLERGRAIGVKLSSGEELRARNVISNADPAVTYGQLIGAEHLGGGLKKKLAATRWSLPAISLFFSADVDPARYGIDSGNLWLCRDPDVEGVYRSLTDGEFVGQELFPGAFLSATSLKDPTSFDGRHHTFEAFTFVPWALFEKFAGVADRDHCAGYQELKATLTRQLLNSIEALVPGLVKHIVFSELGTPLTNLHYVCATRGNCYGTEKSRWQVGPFTFANRSPFGGLTLCGASTMGNGVMGASISGLGAVAQRLGCRPSELLKNKEQKLHTYLADDDREWPEALKDRRNRARRAAPGPVASGN